MRVSVIIAPLRFESLNGNSAIVTDASEWLGVSANLNEVSVGIVAAKRPG
jgi:hypothetical protein